MADWRVLVVCGLLVAGCGKEPIFESVATVNTGKEKGTTVRFNLVSFPPASVSLATGCGPLLSGCSYTLEAVGLAGSDDRQKPAGPSGTASWSLPGDDQWVGVTIEIKRPPDSGPVVQ